MQQHLHKTMRSMPAVRPTSEVNGGTPHGADFRDGDALKLRANAALERHLAGRDQPPTLGRALRHALFPGGGRVRPVFSLSVSVACGDDRPAVADAAAAALELLHCASLVHDDLPCFDDAQTRRGVPSVHAAYGEALAVLAGDGLIVLAFQALADVSPEAGDRLGRLMGEIAGSAGMPHGLVSGQALESEQEIALSTYHAAKTGALFEAAAAAGAIAAGADPEAWRPVGRGLGAAYQIADDLHDHVGTDGSMGKPTGQDARLERPSAVSEYGCDGAVLRLKTVLSEAADAVPDGPLAPVLRQYIASQAARFVPALAAA